VYCLTVPLVSGSCEGSHKRESPWALDAVPAPNAAAVINALIRMQRGIEIIFRLLWIALESPVIPTATRVPNAKGLKYKGLN
jgi:hypothetical protein